MRKGEGLAVSGITHRIAVSTALALALMVGLPAAAAAQSGKPRMLLGYNDNFNRFELHQRNEPKDFLPPLIPLPPIIGGGENEPKPDPEPRRTELLKLAREGGADVVRYVVPWVRVERQRGKLDFEFDDRSYELALELGLRPVIVLISAPCWARPTVPCNHKRYAAVRPDPAFLPAWGRFVRAAVERYPRAAAFEIWNESNAVKFWGPDPSPARYRALLAEAHRQTRDLARRPPILFNGVMPTEGWRRFVRRSYLRLGAGKLADATALHPYVGRRGALAAAKEIRRVRRILRRAGAQRRVWITEAGWSTHPDAAVRVSPAGQARRAERLRRVARSLGSPAMIVHRLQDIEHESAWESGLGVVNRNGSPKPLFCRLAILRGGSTRAC
jgi:polysaccharide biosynthesis protein PslG